MGKFFLFSMLWWLTGNPFVALLVLLAVLYFLDRRYVGLFPSIFAPFRRNRRLAAVRRELESRPYDTSGKLEAARLLMEKKRYRDAVPYLEEVRQVMDDSAEVLASLGVCKVKTGDVPAGESLILEGFAVNPRVQYGEPYLRLAEAYTSLDPAKAVSYIERFRQVQSSSCEAYYRLARLYELMGRREDAKEAYGDTLRLYRGLPKYKRKTERRWALLAMLKK